jgi:Mn2+/Fe2+ NRAMP family transporter
MKGPFLGTGLPETEYLLGAIALLLVGLVLLRSGLSSLIHHRGSTERVVISNKKT